jgi:hypothetical protein
MTVRGLFGESKLKQRRACMSRELVARNRPVFDHRHPKIYGAAVGLIAWFALMAWCCSTAAATAANP